MFCPNDIYIQPNGVVTHFDWVEGSSRFPQWWIVKPQFAYGARGHVCPACHALFVCSSILSGIMSFYLLSSYHVIWKVYECYF